VIPSASGGSSRIIESDHNGEVLFGRYSKRDLMRRYRRQVENAGHYVCARWLDESAEENAQTALRDLVDVADCDCIVLFTEQPRTPTRAGRWCEFGFALGLDKEAIAVGPVENIYSFLPDVRRYGTWREFITAVKRRPSMRHVWSGPSITAEAAAAWRIEGDRS
jgi:hypothetical protein